MGFFDDIGNAISGAANAIGGAVEQGLSDVGQVASGVVQEGAKLLTNPAVDTAIGSFFGMPELGMVGQLLGGLDSAGGGSPLNLLGQLPGMLSGLPGLLGGAGSNPLQGLLGGGGLLGGLLGGGGLGNILGGGFPGGGIGFPGGGGGIGFPGGGGGVNSGIPSAGGFDPNQFLNNMIQQGQQSLQFQQQVSAIKLAIDACQQCVKIATEVSDSAIKAAGG